MHCWRYKEDVKEGKSYLCLLNVFISLGQQSSRVCETNGKHCQDVWERDEPVGELVSRLHRPSTALVNFLIHTNPIPTGWGAFPRWVPSPPSSGPWIPPLPAVTPLLRARWNPLEVDKDPDWTWVCRVPLDFANWTTGPELIWCQP